MIQAAVITAGAADSELQAVAAAAPAHIVKAVMNQKQAPAGCGLTALGKSGHTSVAGQSGPLVLDLPDPPVGCLDAADPHTLARIAAIAMAHRIDQGLLQTELQTLFQAAQTAQAATPPNEQNVQNAIRAFQTAQQAAEREIATLNAPIELAVSYVQEQITLRMNEAVTAARTARRADIVLTRGAAIQVADSANITPAIVVELNRLVPNVQIVPPQGYEPGSLMRAQQQQAAAAAAGTPAPAATPETR